MTCYFVLDVGRTLVCMTVKLRVLGDPDEVAQVLAALNDALELAWDGRTYPNRGGFGVRAYLEARPRPTAAARAERIDRPRLPASEAGR